MKEGFLNTLQEYLLTLDENIRESITESLSPDDLKKVLNIEIAFLSDKKINELVQELQLESIEEEIKDLHAEYFLQLAELYFEGKRNKEIETLLSSDNQNFKKTVSLFSDEAKFFRELSVAVDDKMTEKLKKGYAEIDEWLVSKKTSQSKTKNIEFKVAANIFSIRRKILNFAIAATMVGVLIGGVYLRFFNYEKSNENSLAKNVSLNTIKPIIANIELPNLIKSNESEKSILIDKTSSGFASEKVLLTINSNELSKQIDTLRSLLEITNPKNSGGDEPTYTKVSKQIDSLLSILNSYTYDYKKKKVVLNVPKVTVINNIICINPNNLSELYIKIENKFYLIKKTEMPIKLLPLDDKKLIEELNNIINFSQL